MLAYEPMNFIKVLLIWLGYCRTGKQEWQEKGEMFHKVQNGG